ncbi:MAG: class I SAM-dependent methyltransferase [Magnetococcus sp. THC-1_WYH]
MSCSYYYDNVFISAATKGNQRSARVLTAMLASRLNPLSVVDFGCAEGGWLAAWREQGVTDILGLDGAYVNQDRLLIPQASFKVVDLTQSVDLGRRFDLAMSVEVAEHLPQHAASTFVESLTCHADLVLFSAATPGQGGEQHINEQSYEYWRDIFIKYDYVMLNWCRDEIKNNREVQPWYRYNLFLFVNKNKLNQLPTVMTDTLLPPEIPVPDMAPWWYRVRKQVVRRLPFFLCQWMAKCAVRIRAY